MVRSLNMAEIPPPPDALKNLMFQNFNLAIFRFPPPSLARYWTAAPLTNSPPSPARSQSQERRGTNLRPLYSNDQVREAPPWRARSNPIKLSALASKHRWLVKYASSPLQRGASRADILLVSDVIIHTLCVQRACFVHYVVFCFCGKGNIELFKSQQWVKYGS